MRDRAANTAARAGVMGRFLSEWRCLFLRYRTESRPVGEGAIVFGADELLETVAVTQRPERGETLPRHGEGAGVFHGHDDFDALAERVAVGPIALHHVDLVGMWRSERIDDGHLVG